MIYASQNEAVCCEVQTYFGSFLRASFRKKLWAHFGSFRIMRFMKKVLGAFSWFLHPKMKLFVVKFRRIVEVTSVQALWKSSGRIFTMYTSKNVTVCHTVQTYFGSSPLARLTEKGLVDIFHDLCMQKRSYLLCSSDAFWKFSACKVCRKSSWWNFMIYAPKNYVCCEVQTHVGSFLLASFVKNFWAHFHVLCVQKQSCLLWN